MGRIGISSTVASGAAVVALSLAVAGCGGTRATSTTSTARPQAATEATIWLCRPGQANNPCLSSLGATVVEPSGATHVIRPAVAKHPGVDCFYVYPTISDQSTVNANRAVGLRQIEIAIAQASRFSQVCNVYAPVYRQITLSALDHPARITVGDALVAYRSVRSAFQDYLAHYNHGRGIVLIGHSQGAAILIRLLRRDIDGNKVLRKRLVSALLLGGNVTTRRGGTTGGDFAHIPACTSRTETGCVVAYSSFTQQPPANSQFGRTTSDAGVKLLAPHEASSAIRIMCVNPAEPSGGPAALDPYIPALALAFLPGGSSLTVKTPWVAFPGAYTGRCESAGDATWLQIARVANRSGAPSLTALGQPVLGLHVLDVNIALGNLVSLVGEQAASFRRR